MRLSERERRVINDAVRRRFGTEAAVYLFGSRVHDTLRGGDFDLYVITLKKPSEAHRARILAISDIQLAVGDQKIDMVVSPLIKLAETVRA